MWVFGAAIEYEHWGGAAECSRWVDVGWSLRHAAREPSSKLHRSSLNAELLVVWSHMFVCDADGALCYHGGTPVLTGECAARGARVAARESLRDRCERVVRSSAVSPVTGTPLTAGPRLARARRRFGFVGAKSVVSGPFGAASRLRHATRRLMRGNSARRTTPAYATGVGRALSARVTPPGVVRVPRGGASGVRMGANFGGMLGNFDRLVRVPGKLTSRLRKFPGNFTLAGPFILLVLYTFWSVRGIYTFM